MMRFSDLGRRPRGIRGIGVLPTATNAIASGESTFTQAYAQAGGSLQGTAAVAAGIVAQLPAGKITAALNTVMSAIGDAEAGAAIGSVIPGYGTAIGAAIGAIVGIISEITGSTPANPTGEFRSTAERFVYPSLPLQPTVGESPSALVQVPFQPAVWPTYRQNASAWQPVQTDSNLGDPAPSQSEALQFTFGVGWVSPPSSTPASTSQAYYAACAWMSGNAVARGLVLPKDDANQDFASFRAAANGQALTSLGSQEAMSDALALFTSWYEQPWSLTIDETLQGTITVPGKSNWSTPQPGGYQAVRGWQGVWESMLYELRLPVNALDWTYYSANYILTGGGNLWGVTGMTSWFLDGVNDRLPGVPTFSDKINIARLPDTLAIALYEYAILSVTGVLPRDGADIGVLHFLLGLQWSWHRGWITDAGRKSFATLYGITNDSMSPLQPLNPNISRCIGIVQAKIRAAKTTSASSASTSSSASSSAASAAAASTLAAANLSLAQARLTAARKATPAAPPPALPAARPTAVVASSASSPSSEELGGLIVGLAAIAAGAVRYRKKRKRSS